MELARQKFIENYATRLEITVALKNAVTFGTKSFEEGISTWMMSQDQDALQLLIEMLFGSRSRKTRQ